MSKCASCGNGNGGKNRLIQLGVDTQEYDYVLGLAGNPNTGKSTVFNALTGLRQHTGNWPGKTVVRAEGSFEYHEKRFKLIDLPGTYSLLSTSTDEEIARNFILFGQPDAIIVVVDATCLERNLNLVLQLLEITDRVVVCLNLMDEARRKGISVNEKKLASELGVPVVPCAARHKVGLKELTQVVEGVASGRIQTHPRRLPVKDEMLAAVGELVPLIESAVPGLPNARWIAMRLLDGDSRVKEALESGELVHLAVPGRRVEETIGPAVHAGGLVPA